jgi:UDP-N-acetylmuramate dehydrogenase
MRRLNESQLNWLSENFKGRVRFDAPMAAFTSFRIGGAVEALATPLTQEELILLVKGAHERRMGYQVIGGGTNLLVTDEGISGLVIRLTECLNHILSVTETADRLQLNVGAGVSIRHLCTYCLSKGIKGMNFAIGIPGTVGGGLIMNAGTNRGCMAEALSSIQLLMETGEIKTVGKTALIFDHRSLSGLAFNSEEARYYPPVILGGDFSLSKGEVKSLKAEAREIMRTRAKQQPIGYSSAGCIFKNPPHAPTAGQLIDMAGLKGRRKGGAQISERHANFIINTGGATSADVLALMSLIQETVWNRFQIRLEPEVKIVGD